MNRILAVYDVDPFYADRFAEFVNRKETVPFTAVAFTGIARLKEYMESQPVEILLVGDEVKEEELRDFQEVQIVRLSETRAVKDRGPAVYKYQASDSVLREVMACYRTREEPGIKTLLGSHCQIIGVYSPVGRCGKSGFALTLGQVLAKDNPTLLLSLEEFSGMSALTETAYSACLSDLLYHLRQGEYGRLCLGSVVYSLGDLDYVPPVIYGEDLAGVNGKEISHLIGRIVEEGDYQVVIVDLGHFTQGIEEILSLCHTIYAPIQEDVVSGAKLEEWKQYLMTSNRDSIWEKVRILQLPKQRMTGGRESYLEQLLWGEVGDYTRSLIQGNGDYYE